MKKSILIEYDGGLNVSLDERIMKAIGYSFTKKGNFVHEGSGCCMFAPFTRDQSYASSNSTAIKNAELRLKKIQGIRVRIA